jgi:hypothetical protein
MSPPLALSCCLECLLIFLTGERLNDKHSEGQLVRDKHVN